GTPYGLRRPGRLPGGRVAIQPLRPAGVRVRPLEGELRRPSTLRAPAAGPRATRALPHLRAPAGAREESSRAAPPRVPAWSETNRRPDAARTGTRSRDARSGNPSCANGRDRRHPSARTLDRRSAGTLQRAPRPTGEGIRSKLLRR